MPNLLLSLALVFLPLSFATIGGGLSAFADMHLQVVGIHRWMTETEFLNAFALARMAPGPGSLLSTLVGWHVAGFWGAIVTTLAIFAPAALLTYGMAHIWGRFEGARWQRALEAGLRPVAAGMILSSVYVLLQALEGGWQGLAIALGSTALLMLTRVHPLLLLASGAALVVFTHGV